MPFAAHRRKNQIHSKASKPYFQAYHGNTVTAGTVVMMNMKTAGMLNGTFAARTSVIDFSASARPTATVGVRILAGELLAVRAVRAPPGIRDEKWVACRDLQGFQRTGAPCGAPECGGRRTRKRPGNQEATSCQPDLKGPSASVPSRLSSGRGIRFVPRDRLPVLATS